MDIGEEQDEVVVEPIEDPFADPLDPSDPVDPLEVEDPEEVEVPA
jgi:hypothetical protein